MTQSKPRTAILVALLLAAALFAVFNLLHEQLESVTILPVNPAWIIPFVLLLGSIAVMPFINRHWWEHNYPIVSYVLGAIVVLYYIFGVDNVPRLLKTAEEYVSFICLIGSLFVVSGGIHIRIRGKAAPYENILLLGTGAVIANILGTTGASMLLIRPFIRMNKYRIRPYHIVFFIFIVSNVGGALTPIGDPPLFLGYLKGIPFFWILDRIYIIWLLGVGLLLVVFFVIDSRNFTREKHKIQDEAFVPDEWHASGMVNVFFLIVILGAVFITKPVMLREVLMIGAALASYYLTPHHSHHANDFNFAPIKEVAILFAGIFATMIPALDWLELNSRTLGIVTPGQYFWATGALSSFLDNAPTYLNFLSAAFGLHGANVDNWLHMQVMLDLATPADVGLPNPLSPGGMLWNMETWHYVLAISTGAVFFGACTYIGNGPNFMVKSIAEHNKIAMPSFFGYIVKYTLPILIPIFVIIWLIFFN